MTSEGRTAAQTCLSSRTQEQLEGRIRQLEAENVRPSIGLFLCLLTLTDSPDSGPKHVAYSFLGSSNKQASPTSATDLHLDFGSSPIAPEVKEHILEQIKQEVSYAFSRHDLDIGNVSGVAYRIEFEPHIPFKEQTRRVCPADFEDLRCHLQELLTCGIIEESNSPYASAIVLARKKNGDLRMVVDYRKLNSLTKKDAYPLPRIEETFSLLAGSKWFTVLDLKSGYYQLEVEPADHHKTAFTTPFGNCQFRRLPQGLTNSPATFQRTMEKVTSGLNLQEVLAFLDDLIIFSDQLAEHQERLMRVLKSIAEFGLKLSPSKCKFFQTSVKYLGHVISADEIQPDPEKVLAVKNGPVPKTVKELRSFLVFSGFSGYYQRFVHDYAKIVRPLNDLLKGENSTRRKGSKYGYQTRSKLLTDRWSKECQVTFQNTVEKLTSTPVLGLSD
ncbi:hypothetical protein SRHO_G00302130 [Serrasalmus rhombeus]